LLPVALLFLFAYALNLDVKDIPLAVVDLDHTPESRAYAQALVNTGKFVLAYRPDSPEEAEDLLDRGQAQVVLIIPGGFARALRRGETAQVQTLVDGTFPTSARVVRAYVDAVNDAFLAELAGERLAALQAVDRHLTAPAVVAIPQVRYNPAMRSESFIVPGLIGVLLMAFPPLLAALAIVREKEHGSIQQIFVSPLRPWAFIVGKLLPYLLIAFGELALILLAARYWFRVPLQGSLALFLLASIPYAVSTVGTDHDAFVPLLRLHVPHFHHAHSHASLRLPLPCPVLHQNHLRCVPQGCGLGNLVASTGGAHSLHPGHPGPGRLALPKEGGMMVNRRLWGLMRKEFIQFARDRALVLLILYTFVEIAICGWALTLEVRNMATAVYDGDHTPETHSKP